MSEVAIRALRKAVSTVGDKFKTGDVIRWVAADMYTYVAVKTPVGWYTTANNNYYVPNRCSFDELIKILGRSETTDIEVATEWTSI